MDHQELTKQIIGCAYKVHNVLGSGFVESVYERSLAIEMAKSGLDVVAQKHVPVYYEQHLVGEFKADLIVDNTVIVELKATETLSQAHEIQLVNYLVATKKPIGLLLNFGSPSVEVRRKTPQPPSQRPSQNEQQHPVHPANPVIPSREEDQQGQSP
jgi:GxxExxY protein